MTLAEADPTVEVWPCNWPTVQLFSTMATQWRVGAGGPIGLDYSALPHVMRLTGAKRADWSELFDGVRVMESAALEKLREKK